MASGAADTARSSLGGRAPSKSSEGESEKTLARNTTVVEMWWCLTDDGLQRLTQSRVETSLSLTDDGLDDGGSL